MVVHREPSPLNRRVGDKEPEGNVVPFRPKRSRFEGGNRRPDRTEGPPQRILLATDLSFRCERALGRAAALSAQWRSALVVLHVLDTPVPVIPEAGHRPSWPPVQPRSLAWKKLLADVGAVTRKATLLVREGDPTEAIVHTAETEQCNLIVLGITQDAVLERIFLDRTIDRLLRRSRVPLLVVKERHRRPYRDIVVATDLSDASRQALEGAARIFPEQALTVFHAYDAPFSGLTVDSRAHQRDCREIAVQECGEFLKRVRRPAVWWPEHVVIENGSLDLLLRDYVRDMDVDLVVLGMHRRNTILEMVVGNVAKAIMDKVPCDVLVIQEPHDAEEM